MVVPTLPDRIVLYPDPVLREASRPFEVFDESIARLASRMLELMRAGRGVGLAGPQVGIARRIFVCNPTGEPQGDRVYVNPELSELLGAAEAEEGCLSLPDVHIMMRRAKRCRIKAVDVAGRPIEAEGEELVARIWQHEADHLDGVLIIDRMNATDKIANKKPIAKLEADYKQLKKKAAGRDG